MATFKYGNTEFDLDLSLQGLSLNKEAYIKSLGLNAKDSLRLSDAILDMLSRMESGDITEISSSGRMHSNSDFTNNPVDKKFLGIKTGKGIDPNGMAVLYALEFFKNAPTSSNSEKEKYTNTGIDKAFMDLYFGGNSPDTDTDAYTKVWLDLDKIDESGKRGRLNRLNAFASILNNYANSDLDKYDYTGSAHKDAEDYRTKLRTAAAYAESGDFDAFTRAYAATGGNMNNFNAMFTEGSVLPTAPAEQSAIDTAIESRKEELKAKGMTPEQIESIINSEKLLLLLNNELEVLDATKELDWRNYATSTFTSKASGKWSLDDYNGGKARGDAFWIGNLGKASGKNGGSGEYDKESFFNKYKELRNQILNKMRSGQALSDTIIGEGVSEAEIGAAMMHYLYKYKKSEFLKEKDGSLIYKASIQPNGAAYRYDPNTRTLHLYHVLEGVDSELKNEYRRRWENKRKPKISWKHGGSIEKLKVLRAATGADFDKIVKSKAESDKIKLEKAAKAEGKTVKQYRADNRHISMDNGDNFEFKELSGLDWARLGGMAADIAAVVTPSAISSTAGLTSTVLNLGADIADVALGTGSIGSLAKNLALGVGLSGLSLINADKPGRIAKLVKSAKTFVPMILGAANAGIVALDSDTHKSLYKLLHSGDKNRLTVQDWKNIGHAFTALVSLRRAGEAGLVAVKMRNTKTGNQIITTKSGKNVVLTPEEIQKVNESGATGGNKSALETLKSLGKKKTSTGLEIDLSKETSLPEGVNFKAKSKLKNPFGIRNNSLSGKAESTTSNWVNQQEEISRQRAEKANGKWRTSTMYEIYGKGWSPFTNRMYTPTTAPIGVVNKKEYASPKSSPFRTHPSSTLEDYSKTRALYNPLSLARLQSSVGKLSTFRPYSKEEFGQISDVSKLTTIPSTSLTANPSKVYDIRKVTKPDVREWEINKWLEIHPNAEYKAGISGDNFNGMLIDTDGSSIMFKKGGKLEQLQALKSFSEEGTTSFKNGGIVKYLNPPHGIISNPQTWSTDVFSLLQNKLYDDLKSGKISMQQFNNYQLAHANSYKAAKLNGFYNNAYVPTTGSEDVSELEKLYNGWGYNDIAIAPNEKNGRYKVLSTNPTSGDSKEGNYNADNLYSGKHDDRHFGRYGSLDENSEAFKLWKAKLNGLGFDYTLDKDSGYYLLSKLNNTSGFSSPDSNNLESNQDSSGLTNSTSERDSNESSNGSYTDPRGHYKGKNNLMELKKSIGKTLDSDTFADALTLMLANKLARNAYDLMSKTPVPLQSHTSMHLSTMNDPSGAVANYRARAHDIMSAGNRMAKNASNAIDAYAIAKEAYNQGADIMKNADLLANENWLKSFLTQLQQEALNVATKDNDRNVNEGTIKAKIAENAGFKASRDQEITNNYIKSISGAAYRRHLKEQENQQKALAALLYAHELDKAATLKPQLDAINDARFKGDTKAEETALKDYMKAVKEYEPKELEWMRKYYELQGIPIDLYLINPSHSWSYNSNFSGKKIRSTKVGGKLDKLKSGNRISDDGPVRSKHKNADRYLKTLKLIEESNLKNKDRIGKLIEMYAKRAMGKA